MVGKYCWSLINYVSLQSFLSKGMAVKNMVKCGAIQEENKIYKRPTKNKVEFKKNRTTNVNRFGNSLKLCTSIRNFLIKVLKFFEKKAMYLLAILAHHETDYVYYVRR